MLLWYQVYETVFMLRTSHTIEVLPASDSVASMAVWQHMVGVKLGSWCAPRSLVYLSCMLFVVLL
jgi:hypothetical protein